MPAESGNPLDAVWGDQPAPSPAIAVPFDEAMAGHTTPGTLGQAVADILVDTGTTLQGELDGIQADTEDIQSRLPAALVSGRIDASVGAMAADVVTSSALAASAVSEIQSGLSTLDAAGIRTALGLASANVDTQLAAIAAKSLKEVRYHLRHSRDWLVRLGDGTDVSHAKAQAALDQLLPYTQEFWSASPQEVAALANGTGIDMAALQADWNQIVDTALQEATLKRPAVGGFVPTGKQGIHSEHLGFVLAEMQSLARQHPGATW